MIDLRELDRRIIMLRQKQQQHADAIQQIQGALEFAQNIRNEHLATPEGKIDAAELAADQAEQAALVA